MALPGAAADGTARLSVRSGGVERPYLLAPALRVAPRGTAALLVVLPAANTTLRAEYDRYGLDAMRDHGLTVLVAGTYAASWTPARAAGDHSVRAWTTSPRSPRCAPTRSGAAAPTRRAPPSSGTRSEP